MNQIRRDDEYWLRLGNARRAPKAETWTRVLLIANERGLTTEQLQEFYFQRRSNSKPLFDYELFAKKQGISLDWLWDGHLSLHPRGHRERSSDHEIAS